MNIDHKFYCNIKAETQSIEVPFNPVNILDLHIFPTRNFNFDFCVHSVVTAERFFFAKLLIQTIDLTVATFWSHLKFQ